MVGQLGIAQWTFSTPVSDFGGYFENNSRFDDAVVDFYGQSGSLLGELTATVPHAAQMWTWNGWHSDIPIAQIVITGNDVGFLNGFIWYDDFQANVALSSVPEPASWALLATAFAVAAPCAPTIRALAKSLRRRRWLRRDNAYHYLYIVNFGRACSRSFAPAPVTLSLGSVTPESLLNPFRCTSPASVTLVPLR